MRDLDAPWETISTHRPEGVGGQAVTSCWQGVQLEHRSALSTACPGASWSC